METIGGIQFATHTNFLAYSKKIHGMIFVTLT